MAFLNVTQNWSGSIDPSGAAARLNVLAVRQTSLSNFIDTIQGLLKQTDNLYNARYLWIQQRTDKQNGLLTQQVQAMNQRITNTNNLISNQQKIMVINSVANSI